MTQLPNGQFGTQKHEVVTVRVVATNTPNLASFPEHSSCGNQLVVARPDHQVATGTFQMPATTGVTCAVVVVFNFQSDSGGNFPPGAKYDVTLEGGGNSIPDSPFPPPPGARTYEFVVTEP